jgi:hypothetical protein
MPSSASGRRRVPARRPRAAAGASPQLQIPRFSNCKSSLICTYYIFCQKKPNMRPTGQITKRAGDKMKSAGTHASTKLYATLTGAAC